MRSCCIKGNGRNGFPNRPDDHFRRVVAGGGGQGERGDLALCRRKVSRRLFLSHGKRVVGIFGDHQHSFEADITILPLGPDTRRTYRSNGIRWDFCLVEDLNDRGLATDVYMVWPEFVDESGASIPAGVPLEGRLHALMHIVAPDMIDKHRERLKVGSRFVCTEGPRPVAEGVVTSLSPMA